MNNFFNIFKKSPQKPHKQKYKKVLSLDGGGVRAIAGIVFLKKLEAESGKKIFNTFDMFVGTSAGAFNAACLAYNGMQTSELKSTKLDSSNCLGSTIAECMFVKTLNSLEQRTSYPKLEVPNEIILSCLFVLT